MSDFVRWDDCEQAAADRWGFHPVWWPRPPRKMPKWWQISARREVNSLGDVFGLITENGLDRFWEQHAKGQSVFEDAGGYLLRCYKALASFPVEDDHYSYYQAVQDALDAPRH